MRNDEFLQVYVEPVTSYYRVRKNGLKTFNQRLNDFYSKYKELPEVEFRERVTKYFELEVEAAKNFNSGVVYKNSITTAWVLQYFYWLSIIGGILTLIGIAFNYS